MKPENRPKIEFEGREYDDYQATQKQRQIERTIRKQKRRKAAYEAAGLTEDAQAANIRLGRLSEKYRQFSRAAGLPEQRERMKVLDGYKPVSRGQSAGNSHIGQPGKPVQIGSVNFSDRSAVLAQMDAAQAETAALDYEVNRTVTADGKVWRVSGDGGFVDVGAIPSDLSGSYSYHNHPAEQTWFSFSAEDVRCFFESGQAYSRASDYLYEYVMERTPETLAISPEMAYYRFREIENTSVAQMKWDELIDPDMDGFHETMKILSQELKFFYERKKKSG